MPDYEIKIWNASNLDLEANEWTRRAYASKSPVFLAEYFRWTVLQQYGGIYLDADCEILSGAILHGLIEDLYSSSEYDAFFGVEERSNGHPTAQTIAAKPESDLISFMKNMYDNSLSGPLWHWREERGLIGPQLMSLYFRDRGVNIEDGGFFKNLDDPQVAARCKVYPQQYFSPKFSLLGETINFKAEETCVYHMFANANVDYSSNPKFEKARERPLTFAEYQLALSSAQDFPRHYKAVEFQTKVGKYDEQSLVADGDDGVLSYGPYITLEEGEYVANFTLAVESMKGTVEFYVTAESGAQRLAHESLEIRSPGPIVVPINFAVLNGKQNNIEFVIMSIGVERIRFDGLLLENVSGLAHGNSLEGMKNVHPAMKVIHRIYFGFDGKPDPFETYLQTWIDNLPGYKIMKWDASNLPMNANAYVRRLYDERDHAFLSDYFRWHVLREHGGIYLDADVEVYNGKIFNEIVEELEQSKDFDAVIGIDEIGGGWYTAHSVASKPGSDLSRFMCNVYDHFGNFTVWRKKGFYFWAPQLVALYFANNGHNVQGMGASPGLLHEQIVARVKILPQPYFSPISPGGDASQPFKLNGLADITCLCHHFACSWHDDDSFYVQHSKRAGGQTGVLLSSIINESRVMRFDASSSSLSSAISSKKDGGIPTVFQSGILVYGPYVSLDPGTYRVVFHLDDLVELAGVSADVVCQGGTSTIANRSFTSGETLDNAIELSFEIDTRVADLECRLIVSTKSSFIFRCLQIILVGS